MKAKFIIIMAMALITIIVISAFAYMQQNPQKQNHESFTLRPVFFTLPFTYFDDSPSYSSMTLASFSGNYTNLVITNNYSEMRFNESSSSGYAFNILGEQKFGGYGPIVVSGYIFNSSGWFAQSGFYINATQKTLNTVSVSGLAGSTNDQIIISNNQLTIKQSGITLLKSYNLPPNFYVDGALSEGLPNRWIGGNVYVGITGIIPSNSVEAKTIASLEGTGLTPAVNLDGDLKMKLSSAQRNLIWAGTQLNEMGNWFAGDAGESNITLDYNFNGPHSPFGICNIDFVNASGNRPFPYMSYSNYAIPKIYYSNATKIVVHFDIKMLNFTTENYMRTGVVVELMDNSGHPYYFEQDIKDGAKEILPYFDSTLGVWENVYNNATNGEWLHFDVPFNTFISTHASQTVNNCFVQAFYLVNECFGSGYVSYYVTNWSLTT